MTDEQMTDEDFKEKYFDEHTVYVGEITYEEDGTVVVVRTVDAGPDGYLIMVETEEGGAIVDLLPDKEEAVARSKEIVAALNSGEEFAFSDDTE